MNSYWARPAIAGLLLAALVGVPALAGNWSKADAIFPGAYGSQCVALTFDDGPDPVLTPQLLDTLAASGVKATFYVVGRNVAAHPDIVARAAKEGHEIGNHSWSHPVLPSLSNAQIESEIKRTDAAIQAATGTIPATIRPPYGSRSMRVVELLAPRPLILWDTDTLDWMYRNSDRVTRVAESTPGGTIVLMHDVHPTTVAAVPGLIKGLKERGFTFVTISQLLTGACGSKGEIGGRGFTAPIPHPYSAGSHSSHRSAAKPAAAAEPALPEKPQPTYITHVPISD
jgi:peptidoglycan/xylan/chitin deacetylase (PgdA/CDA1 family)